MMRTQTEKKLTRESCFMMSLVACENVANTEQRSCSGRGGDKSVPFGAIKLFSWAFVLSLLSTEVIFERQIRRIPTVEMLHLSFSRPFIICNVFFTQEFIVLGEKNGNRYIRFRLYS